MARTSLDNGETVWIVARETEFDRRAIPSEERWTESTRFHNKEAFLDDGVELENLTSMLWNAPQDGERLQVIEIGGIMGSVKGGMPVFRIEPTVSRSAATDECLVGRSISDASWAEVVKHVTDPGQQVEFIITLGNWMMFSMLFRNLRIPLERKV